MVAHAIANQYKAFHDGYAASQCSGHHVTAAKANLALFMGFFVGEILC